MADQKEITLYEGDATPKDIVLRALPIASVSTTTIWLVEGASPDKDIILGDPTVQPSGAPAFPTQYGFRFSRKTGSTIGLCVVDVADAPSGMGGVRRVFKGGVTYAFYLVETTDPNASPRRIRTTTGTKSIRLKT